ARYANNSTPQADLDTRVEAYHRLLWFILNKAEERDAIIQTVQEGRSTPPGDFIPVNYFWANVDNKTTQVKAIETVTSNTLTINTSNFMGDMVVKRNVRRPVAYAIPP